VKCETCEKGAIRSSKFGEPRTLACPASLARLSCGVVSCCHIHPGHWISGGPASFFRSLLDSQTATGDATKTDGEAYVVPDSPGKDVCLHVDKKSKRDDTFDAGDNSL
jgi:hypothetical protein